MGNLVKKSLSSIKGLWKRGAFHVFIGNFATKFVTFFGSVVLAKHLLSKTDYGMLGYMENLCSFAYIFAGLGLSYALLRYSVLSNDIEKKCSYFRFAVSRGFMFNIILVIAMCVFDLVYNHSANYERAYYLLPILILALPFQHLVTDSQMNERAMFNNRRYAFVCVFSAFFVVLARVVGALQNKITGVVIGIVIVNIILGFLLCGSGYRKYFKGVKAVGLSKAEKKQATSYAVQYMITNGLWALFMLIDTFLIGRLIDDPTVLADYKIAYVFPGNMAIISGAIGIFVGPYFVKHETDFAWVRKNYIKTFFATAGLIALAVLVLYLLTPPIISIFYGAKYLNNIGLMRMLLISCFINCGLRYTTANLLASMGQVKYNMMVSGVGIVLQVILDITLIPHYGTYGVAFAGIVSYSFMAITLFLVFNKKYNIIGGKKNKKLDA